MGTPSELQQITEFVAKNPWIVSVTIGLVLTFIIIQFIGRKK